MPLDRFALELTGARKPKVLFIPTASGDSRAYCDTFRAKYGSILGCEVSYLSLFNHSASSTELSDLVAAADLIYVGGGNTLRMMRMWKRRGVDSLLRALAGTDKVLAGLSAGGICWHEYGHSDSVKGSTSNYIRVRGLGMAEGMFCPHFTSERRLDDFRQLVRRTNLMGLGCDDLGAIWYDPDGRATVRTAKASAKVVAIRPQGSGLEAREYHDGERIDG